MRTKEKHRFSKVIAVICVLTLCVTMLTPATYGAATDVKKIILTKQSGIEYCDSDQVAMDEAAMEWADDDGYYSTMKGDYRYKVTSDSIEVIPAGESFANVVQFYVNEGKTTKPQVKCDSGMTPRIPNVPTSGTMWSVQIGLKNATNETVTVSVDKQISKYTVTFPKSTSDYEISAVTNQYDENSEVDFSITLKNPAKKITVWIDNQESVVTPTKTDKGERYDYTIASLNKDISVEVIPEDRTFTITGPGATLPNGFTYEALNRTEVKYGDSFAFLVVPPEGQEAPTVSVKDTQGDGTLTKVTSTGTNQYTCTNITADKTIVVEAGNPKQYEVHYARGTGYTINKDDETVNHNADVTFNVTPDIGYKISRVAVNGKTLPPELDGSYKLKVTADATVSVEVQKKQYKISYDYQEDSEAYSVKLNKLTAEYGEEYSFYVTAKTGYGIPKVTVNGNEEQSVDGSKYIINITGDDFASLEQINIVIKAGQLNQQTVTFNPGVEDSYDFTDEHDVKLMSLTQTVEYNKSFSFKINLKGAYSDSNPVVTVNGVNLQAVNDVYTIPNITENKVVSVSGVQKNTYTVTLTQGAGYAFITNDSTKVTAGDTFSFRLNISDGYTNTPKVLVNGDEKIPENGNYSFTVDKNTTVTVTGVNRESYTVQKNVEHAKIEQVGEESIYYNGSYRFTVTPNDYYEIIRVAVNGSTVNPVSGNEYIINNIVNNNNTITVETKPIELTVHYVDEKYNTTVSDRVYTIETTDRTLAMLTAPNGGIYQFTGWKDGSEAVESISDEMLNKGVITLTAVWALDKDSIKSSIKLDTTGSWTENDDHFVLTFNTVISLVDELSEEYKANVQLTGYGTLYSGQSFGQLTQDDINAILGRNQTVNPDALIREQVRNGVYNYFSNINLATSDLNNDDTFKLILNAKKKADRYGLGWIELTVGNEKIIVYYAEAHLTTSD